MNACLFLAETQDACPSTKIMTVLSELFWMASAQQRSVLARQWDGTPSKAMELPSLEILKTQHWSARATCSYKTCFEQEGDTEASAPLIL